MSTGDASLAPTRLIPSGGIDIAVSVNHPPQGPGKLVILMHGWPEQALSWRHIVGPLTQAGFSVAVPCMRGYGASAKPAAIDAYRLDALADDMQAIADALGAARWVSVGHDWGAIVAWRCAVRFPQKVAAVFGMSVPYSLPPPIPFADIIEALYPDRFFYIRYFQQPGVGEAEFDAADTTQALKRIYFWGSGDGVRAAVPRHVPRDATMLDSMPQAPAAPLPFLPEAELAAYAASFRAGGWQGPLNYYRNFDRNAADAAAYGDNIIHQPSGFLAGELDVVLKMLPGQLEHMRGALADMRMERLIPGAGHWIQQERPAETAAALLEFLSEIRDFS